MKQIKVTLSATLELPDDWHIVQREDGMRVFKKGDTFIDLDFLCLSTKEEQDDAEWELDEAIETEFVDYIRGSELVIED